MLLKACLVYTCHAKVSSEIRGQEHAILETCHMCKYLSCTDCR